MSETNEFWQYANEAIFSASYAKINEAEQGLLDFEHLPHGADFPPIIIVEDQGYRTVESCERELIRRRRTEIKVPQPRVPLSFTLKSIQQMMGRKPRSRSASNPLRSRPHRS